MASRPMPRFPIGVLSHLSSSVGDAIVGQLSGRWADGGDGSVNLGGVDHGLVVGSSGSCCESKDGDGGELHLEGWLVLSYLKSN